MICSFKAWVTNWGVTTYQSRKCNLYLVHLIRNSYKLILIEFFALMTIKLSTYLGWLSRTRHDNVWLDYPAQDNWWHISVSPTLSAHQISVMTCHWPLHSTSSNHRRHNAHNNCSIVITLYGLIGSDAYKEVDYGSASGDHLDGCCSPSPLPINKFKSVKEHRKY